jgi:hypothetical protein
MVVCIDDFLQKLHQPAVRVIKVASPPEEVGPWPDDNEPTADPPSAMRLAA